MLRYIFISACVVATSVANAATCPVDPVNPNERQQWCGCPTSSQETGQATTIDVSTKISSNLLKAAKAKGVTAVIRYYDWPHKPAASVKLERAERWRMISSTCQTDATCDKILTQEELDTIRANDMSVAVVFQHFAGDLDGWLDKKRAAYDADRALDLPQQFNQPKNSAIYFGVDGADQNFIDHGDASAGMKHMVDYFRVVSDMVTKAGYAVGVYGSGLVCDQLVD
jgi:hypothetical protein